MGNGAQIHVFELAAHRHAARQARDLDAAARSASAMAWAVASPSAVKLVARITSCTTPSPARSSSFCTPMSRGPTPSSGDSRPMSTKYRPRKAAVRSMAAWSAGVSTTHRRLASRVASMQVAQTSPSVKV